MRVRTLSRASAMATAVALLLFPRPLFAFGGGHMEDKIADVLVWVVIVVAPVVGVVVFLLVHIIPEKVAEKRGHPQFEAIKVLCLLSLFFGGLLWPLAWLWAYSKPVMYKIAYGKDTVDHGHGASEPLETEAEIQRLRERLTELESKPVSGQLASGG